MRNSFEKNLKTELPRPPVDIERKTKEYVKSLIEGSQRVPVDYNQPRPLKELEGAIKPPKPVDTKLFAEAYQIKLRKGKTDPRTHQQIYEDLLTERPKNDN